MTLCVALLPFLAVTSSNVTREYALNIHTANSTDCNNNATVVVTYINGCDMTDSQSCTGTVNSSNSVSNTFNTTTGKAVQLESFTSNSIHTITHLKLVCISSNGWCFDDFDVLIEDSNSLQIWANCSMKFMGFIALDSDTTLINS